MLGQAGGIEEEGVGLRGDVVFGEVDGVREGGVEVVHGEAVLVADEGVALLGQALILEVRLPYECVDCGLVLNIELFGLDDGLGDVVSGEGRGDGFGLEFGGGARVLLDVLLLLAGLVLALADHAVDGVLDYLGLAQEVG